MTHEPPIVLVDATTYLQDGLARAAGAVTSALEHATTSKQLRAALDHLRHVEAEIADYQQGWREWEARERRSRLTLVGRGRWTP